MFSESESLLDRALKVIPNGTQTFSKSHTCYPRGVSPFYAEYANGVTLHDVDGNKFTDFTSGLTAIILGYNDADVQQAVAEQICKGVIYTLPHKLEIEVAEMLVDMIPCAEMVRFGKNGSDTTTGAIRLARAYTGRDHIAHCGYHGFHDWSMANTPRNLGIPQAVKDLTHTFKYNDIQSLERLFDERPNQYAAVIMEPMNREFPQDNFLHKCKELAHQNNALFILDETITGFRFAAGGAGEYFNIMPDLATFGKAIANGYPLSAVVGKREYMEYFNKVHFSFTNAGECLSLAAAKACLTKIKELDVPKRLNELGKPIPGGGHPAWRHLDISSPRYIKYNEPTTDLNNPATRIVEPTDVQRVSDKTLFMQEMHKRGILCLGTVNLNYAHTEQDVATLIQALSEWEGAELECQPLQTQFKIR